MAKGPAQRILCATRYIGTANPVISQCELLQTAERKPFLDSGGAFAIPIPVRYCGRTHPVNPPSGDEVMAIVPLSEVAVHLRPEDNIAVAARNLPPGLEVRSNGGTFALGKRIGLGHKVALL